MGDGQHKMRLEYTHPSGEEEWFCPRCGRRFLLRWLPAHTKTILKTGDEYAIHTGVKGDLSLDTPLSSTARSINIDLALLKTASSSSTIPSTLVEHFTASADELEPELSDDLLHPWAAFLDRPAPEHLC